MSTTYTFPANHFSAYLLHDTANDIYNKRELLSLTRVSTTATAECIGHGFTDQQSATLAGAVETEYNGEFTLTVVDADHFTYTVSGTPATPATGTITAGVPDQSNTARGCHALQVTVPAAGTTLKVEQRIHPDAGWAQIGADITSASVATVTTFAVPVNEVRVRRSAGTGEVVAYVQR